MPDEPDKIQTMQSDHYRELMKLESKHQSELNRKEAEHACPRNHQTQKSDCVAESDYRQSQFPVAQNERHLPQGGTQYHPFRP